MPEPPITAARFGISIDGYEFAQFQSLAGINSEVETVDYIESEEDLRLLMLPLKGTPPVLQLARPHTTDNKIRAWYDSMRRPKRPPKKLCTLVMHDAGQHSVAKYHLENAWPAKHQVAAKSLGGRAENWEILTLMCSRVRRA